MIPPQSRRATLTRTTWLIAALTLAWGQASGQPGTGLLVAPRLLAPPEIRQVLEVTAAAVAGKSFFTYGGFGGGAVTVDETPRVRYAYYGDRATEWPGVAAKHCDGSAAEGELMLIWELEGSSWQVSAGASAEPRLLDSMFELWRQEPNRIQDAGFRDLEGSRLRGLRYPYTAPAGVGFEASWQSVWFDVRTALPVRYEIEIEAPEPLSYGYFLAYAPQWSAGPAASLERPTCLQSTGPRR